jgi:uncharacterized membrane protein
MQPRFSMERINNFCDAVFAIAMTLLILEIKIPSYEDMETYDSLGVLWRLVPNFVGFLISFLVIALYWRAHLMMAPFFKSYDNKSLWLTIWLLLFVVLLPFSTAFYSKFGNRNVPFIFYCINLVMIGVFNYWMLHYLEKKEGHSESLSQPMIQYLKARALSAPIVWALSAAWVFVEPYSARLLFISIFIVQIFIDRRFKKRLSS